MTSTAQSHSSVFNRENMKRTSIDCPLAVRRGRRGRSVLSASDDANKKATSLASSFETSLEFPKIDLDLEQMQEDLGAKFCQEGFVLNYGNYEEEQKILKNECAVIDRSMFGVYRIFSRTDYDQFFEKLLLRAVDGQRSDARVVSQSLKEVRAGQGKRLGNFDVYRQESGAFLVVVNRAMKGMVEECARVSELEQCVNLAARTVLLTVCGPKTKEVLRMTGLVDVLENSDAGTHAHKVFGFENRPVVCCKTNEFVGMNIGDDAVNFVVDEGVAGQVFSAIIKAGAIAVGTEALDEICNNT